MVHNATKKHEVQHSVLELSTNLKEWLTDIDKSITREDDFAIADFNHLYTSIQNHLAHIRGLVKAVDEFELSYITTKIGA